MAIQTEAIESELDKSYAAFEKKSADAIAAIQTQQENYKNALARLKEKLPSLVTALTGAGLEIDTLTQYLPDNGSKVKVNITATPIPGTLKFRFIAFQGYTARGAGKNGAALETKAIKLETVLMEATGIGFSVNQFSLEAREGGKGRVLIDALV